MDETRVTKTDGTHIPNVHTQMWRISGFNLKEHLPDEERNFRLKFHPLQTVLGFSLYYRKTSDGQNHFSITENSLWKSTESSWE